MVLWSSSRWFLPTDSSEQHHWSIYFAIGLGCLCCYSVAMFCSRSTPAFKVAHHLSAHKWACIPFIYLWRTSVCSRGLLYSWELQLAHGSPAYLKTFIADIEPFLLLIWLEKHHLARSRVRACSEYLQSQTKPRIYDLWQHCVRYFCDQMKALSTSWGGPQPTAVHYDSNLIQSSSWPR